MTATVTILHEGAVVVEQQVAGVGSLARLLVEHPPRQARGGVVTLAVEGRSEVIATSVHGPRPRWAVSDRRLAGRMSQLWHGC